MVLSKDPVPGRVKTRLVPALGADGAARLHRALVERCLHTCLGSGLPVTLVLDGDLGGDLAGWARSRGVAVQRQAEGDLGQRLRQALRGPGRLVCVGTDCPDLEARDLLQAARPGPVVLGPALDGGYWLVAIDGAAPPADPPGHALFADIEWSTPQVLAQTLERARAAGLEVRLLAHRRDLDTPADLVEYASDPGCPPTLRPLLGP